MADAHGDFIRLFLTHQRELCAFALARGIAPGEVDDLLQDAAALLWEKFDDFEPGSNFRAWAFQVMRFMVLRRRRAAVGQRRMLRLDTHTEAALEALECDEADDSLHLPLEELHGCLERLGSKARKLLHLRYQEGLEPAVIAEQLGVSAGSLRVRLHRIRHQLLTCIRERQQEEVRP